ncbi:MAG: SusC/RagA family TonB-linked outer membrane protein [Bacteroidales bacterium]|nr:SusC/RagA family TonB-linked outer membrane protein [Bacteroidales bacterium]
MKKLILLLFAIFTVSVLQIYAQNTVTGTVTDDAGEALPGVSVLVKGTTVGTMTLADGSYTIDVPDGSNTLVFSYIGMETQEAVISGDIVDVSLMPSSEDIGEVVVTALGISKEKKALGYAVSEITSEEIQQKAESDVVRLLSGKAAGVRITSTGGVSGTGTNITVRGYSSVTGGNQPLFVVDGVQFSGSTNDGLDASQGFLDGNQATSSRFLDIDPNNIENISVLKGLSATTIYGNQGRNGVIIITTKSGSAKPSKKGFEVSFNQNYFITEVNLPEYQTTYANGFQQNWGFFFSNWGPEMDNDNPLIVPHPFTNFADPDLLAAFPDLVGSDYEVKFYDNQKQFFRKGSISNTSVAFNGSTDNGSYSANVAYNKDIGFLLGNELEKFNVGIGGSTKLSNKITVSGTFNFVKTDMQTPPISFGSGSGTGNGSGISAFADIFYTPVSTDLMGLPFESPVTHESVYYRAGNDIQNPRWTTEYARSIDNVVRVFGSGSVGYAIMDNLNLSYNYGIDHYSETQEYQLNKGSVQNDAYITGLYRTRYIKNTTWDQSVRLTWNYKITDDLKVDVLAGANIIRITSAADGVESQNQLVFGFMNHKNFTDQSSVNSFSGFDMQSKTEVNTLGFFGQTTFGFRDYLYANIAVREDVFSSLEIENRTKFYPSGSVSFLPTEAFPQIKSNGGLNFLKLRFGYGTSAGFPPLYTTRNVLSAAARAYVDNNGNVIPSNSVSNFLGNPDLKPELHTEVEFGIEANGLSNRVGFEFTVYQKTTTDLITDSDLDPATGFTHTYINIGKIANKGLELEMHISPVKTKNFEWTVSGVFTKYTSIVEELAEGQEQVLIAGFTNLGNFARAGEPYGVMMGSLIKTDDAGNHVIAATGDYLESDEMGVIGDPTPDFETSLFNTVRWKGFSFNMQWDYRKGGDIYSGTVSALLARGITKDTEFDRTQTFVLEGVNEDGEVNEVQLTATNFYFNNIGFGPSEVSVYDGTTIRLRDVSLSYNLPSKLFEKIPFGSARITLSGQNLWYKAVNFPEYINFDTDVLSTGVGNGLGFDFITGPSSKRYGVSISLTF